MPIFQKEARITNELETLDLVVYVIFVEIVSRLNVTLENMYKKNPLLFVPNLKFQQFRHILQNPKPSQMKNKSILP